MATAMLAVTVDFPTPPLPLLMAIIRVPADSSVCVILVSLAHWFPGRRVARTELWKVNCCQFFCHAGAIGSVAGRREMHAILTGSKHRQVAAHGQRGRKVRQGLQETVALDRPEAINHTNQVTQRILHEHGAAM